MSAAMQEAGELGRLGCPDDDGRTPTGERAGNGFSGEELSPADDDQVVGEHLEFTDQVTRHEDRAAPCREGAQGVPQPANAIGVEAVGRFVEQQHLGLSQQGAGEGEALAHAEREAAGALVRRALESDLAEDLVDSIRGNRAERCGRPEMVPGCPAGVHAACIEHRADDACGPQKSRVRNAVIADVAVVGTREPDHHPHRRRLAGAVRADESGDSSGRDIEAHLVDGDAVAVVLRES